MINYSNSDIMSLIVFITCPILHKSIYPSISNTSQQMYIYLHDFYPRKKILLIFFCGVEIRGRRRRRRLFEILVNAESIITNESYLTTCWRV